MNALSSNRLALRQIALMLLGVLVVSALLLGVDAMRGSAQGTQPDSGAPLSPSAGPHPCTISNIAVFSSRIHVRCTTTVVVGSNTVRYFAARSDSLNAMPANRYLALMNTAYALGKPLYIHYHASTSLNPPGCLISDCRGIDWMYIQP